MASVPNLEHDCNSWIITRKSTGVAVLETFEREVAEAVNQDKYEVWTALSYLQNLNKRIREMWREIDQLES